ncbi:MAG: uracil-DNA glycosylase [Vicinamibacterales bacterium]|jgi:DNA polymerase|nr:uracil-DNA glycosylase [Vicinamibacterales bacterium]
MSDHDVRAELAAHLRFFAQAGVDGLSRDPAWRMRPADATAEPAAAGEDPPGARATVEHADSAETLELVREDLGACTRCKLHRLGRTQIVYGVGNPRAELMFIGEAPGHDEDIQGIPFVGRAGQLLTKIIEAIDLAREDVYIANVIKCRPPENRNPEPDEVGSCEPFLFRQVQVVRPRVIVALGTFAAQTLLRTNDPISRLRGKVFQFGDARLIPTFHPAYLLRSPDRKREVWEDMKKVRALLRGEDADGGR